MNIKLNLPTILSFYDYHDINAFGEQLKNVMPEVMCEEVSSGKIGLGTRIYHAIVYVCKDDKYDATIKEHEYILHSWEEEN